MKLTLTFLLASLTEAVSFSAWNGLGCRGADVADHKGTRPYICYYIGSSASILAQGLAPHARSEYEVYKDTKCHDFIGFVKYNHLCENYNFLSVAFYPHSGKKQNVTLPPYGSHDWHVRQLRLKRDGFPMDNETEAMPSGKYKKSTRPYLHRRDPGKFYHDHHSPEFGGFDAADGNSPHTANFEFSDTRQEDDWGETVIDRLRNAERNNGRGPIQEYNNNQRVNGRELQVDLIANQGNLNQLNSGEIATCLGIFLDHRTHQGSQRWQFYRNNTPLFTLIFKAVRPTGNEDTISKPETSEQNVRSGDVLEDEPTLFNETLD